MELLSLKTPVQIGIILFDHVDVLDFAGPFEVFSLSVFEPEDVSRLLMKDLPLQEKPFHVTMISNTLDTVTAHNGLQLVPQLQFKDDHPPYDLVIVPGGPLKAVRQCLKNRELLQWIANYAVAGCKIASVCSGALILAEAGLLTGKKATTNAYALEYLEARYPDVEVIKDVRFVDEGNILTSAGVSAGLDMALYLVGQWLGPEGSQRTADTIEYPYWNTGPA
ncbi:DJ-1/PfpI family protein [Paenibacillus lautus]|uniref:DJ-1/PfpI family protein n=1 Tax=Paenibacillus lautus TaxID=1401 RepID=UPI003D2AEF8E